jgi:ATP-dependent Clp protease ATP-binding subunit ClpA
VTDQNPEGKYEALAKYGRDLTQAAREGKLDPVIGRCAVWPRPRPACWLTWRRESIRA